LRVASPKEYKCYAEIKDEPVNNNANANPGRRILADITYTGYFSNSLNYPKDTTTGKNVKYASDKLSDCLSNTDPSSDATSAYQKGCAYQC